MQHILTILNIIFFPMLTMGQLVVNDPSLNAQMAKQNVLRTTANVTMGKQLTESVSQTVQLSNTFKLMKEAHDKLKKISSFIQKYSTISRILTSQKYQYNRIKGALERFSDSPYVTAYDLRILQRCSSNFLKNTNELISVANDIVTPGKSEMNDADRVNLLMQISEKIDSEATATNYFIKNIEEIEKQRAAMARANQAVKRVFTGK